MQCAYCTLSFPHDAKPQRANGGTVCCPHCGFSNLYGLDGIVYGVQKRFKNINTFWNFWYSVKDDASRFKIVDQRKKTGVENLQPMNLESFTLPGKVTIERFLALKAFL